MNYGSIALVGCMGSGKGAGIAKNLFDLGFVPFSGGDLLRGMPQAFPPSFLSNDRMPLIDRGNNVRDEFGPEFIVRLGKVLTRETPTGSRFVFDSLRNPAEIAFLKREMNALVIEVRASPEVRFKRILQRGKPGDPTTWEGFMAIEAIDHGEGQTSTGQNIAACVAMADASIENEGDLSDPEYGRELRRRVEVFVIRYGFIEGNPRSKESH